MKNKIETFQWEQEIKFCLNFKYRKYMTCTFHANSTPEVQTKSYSEVLFEMLSSYSEIFVCLYIYIVVLVVGSQWQYIKKGIKEIEIAFLKGKEAMKEIALKHWYVKKVR